MNPSLIFWHLVIHLQVLHSSLVFFFIYAIFQSCSTLFNFGLVSFTDLMYFWISVPHFQLSFITLHKLLPYHNCSIWLSTVYNIFQAVSFSNSYGFHLLTFTFFLAFLNYLIWKALLAFLLDLPSAQCHLHYIHH